MQPTVVIDDTLTGRVAIHVGALRVTLASENHQGEMVDWAVSELSLKLNVTPVYVDGNCRFRPP